MLSLPEFAVYLAGRRKGESLARIGLSLGVTHEAVRQWLAGTRVASPTVRLLAGALARRAPETWPLDQAGAERQLEDLSGTG